MIKLKNAEQCSKGLNIICLFVFRLPAQIRTQNFLAYPGFQDLSCLASIPKMSLSGLCHLLVPKYCLHGGTLR